MASIVDKAVKEALTFLEENEPGDYEKLTSSFYKNQKSLIIDAARIAAEEETQNIDVQNVTVNDIEEWLSQRMSIDRLKLIKEGFMYPSTFSMDVTMEDDGYHHVYIMSGGNPIVPVQKIQHLKDIDWAKLMQLASIAVEAVLFVLNVVGIVPNVSNKIISKACSSVLPVLNAPSPVRAALDNLFSVWKTGGSAFQKAKAIYEVIKAVRAAGILSTIIDLLFENMSWFDRVKALIVVAAMITASILSGGIALIAKILLALNSAYKLAKKIINLSHLESIQESM